MHFTKIGAPIFESDSERYVAEKRGNTGLMKVLFVGNSYTHCNDLPGMLQDVSRASGKTIETASVTSGGKTLEWHWYNPATLDAIDEANWDFVVLQDHSLGAVEEPEKLKKAAARLGGRIRRTKATPVLYVTWARQHIPEMQPSITETYLRVAREIDAKLAPVGPAWRIALEGTPDLLLHTDDRSHPNILGTYLAACVFFGTLFDENPVGLPNTFGLSSGVAAIIDDNIASILQRAAWSSLAELGGEIT